MFINKVKGLHMETIVDTQRILLVELQTSVNLGISLTALTVVIHKCSTINELFPNNKY